MFDNRNEEIASAVVNAAFRVHKTLGPGLLEKIYEACLEYELIKAGITVERQVSVPINYDGLIFDEGLRLDLLLNGKVIIEIKAVEKMHSVHQSQIISHLRLTGCKIGFLINFNVPLIKQGIQRFVI